MAKQFRLPHKADSFWQSIAAGDGTLFQQIFEENNRAIEDNVTTAQQTGGTLFYAEWTTSDSANPSLTDTTNCTGMTGLSSGTAGVYPNTAGVYTVHVTHTGDGNTTSYTDTAATNPYGAVEAVNGTASGTFLLGSTNAGGIVILPDSDAVGAWSGTLKVFGFRVGESADWF